MLFQDHSLAIELNFIEHSIAIGKSHLDLIYLQKLWCSIAISFSNSFHDAPRAPLAEGKLDPKNGKYDCLYNLSIYINIPADLAPAHD